MSSDEIVNCLKAIHNNENYYHAVMSMFFDANAGTPAHCDNYYLDSLPGGNLTAAWIALEDIKWNSGRFFVCPKSHTFDDSEIMKENTFRNHKKCENFRKNLTIIMVAHRLSTIKNADNIIVIDKGKIVESGKHQNLLNNNNLYSDLWNVQVGI